MRSFLCSLLLLPGLAVLTWAGEPVDDLVAALRPSGKSVAGPAARAAWDRVVAQGPAALPRLLVAMDTPDVVAANWLRTAFDRIVDVGAESGGKNIDVDALVAFAGDAKRQGRARRLALETAEQLRSGTRSRLVANMLDDPEFRFDAVALVLERAASAPAAGEKDRALAAYRQAFEAARDVAQARAAAARLKELGVVVSVADHLGCLRDWHVIGPFDGGGMKSYTTRYPPEEKVDLAAELDGQKGKVRWKRVSLPEPGPAERNTHFALVNLLGPLGQAEDAVAYAFTEFRVPAAIDVELRGAADDYMVVWVNGQRVFGFEEYRNGVRFDRHRFRARLQAGRNAVLVKIGQAPSDDANREPNWEFLLRVVDDTGKGIVRDH